MDIEDVCDLIAMQVMARGLIAILESESGLSRRLGMEAYNEVSTGVSWLHERLEGLNRKLAQEV